MIANQLKTFLIAAIAGSFLTHAAVAKPTNEELKLGISQEFENLNPLIGTMVASVYMNYLAVRNLVVLTPDGKWVPQLAKSIPSLENGQAKIVEKNGEKGLVATWEIIEKAKWGDGTPVTCADIKFTWEAGRNENVSVGERESYENITSIDYDAATPKKCVISYKKAKWDFPRSTPGPMPSHLEGPILKQYGNKKEGYDQNSLYVKTPANPGLYNGPYLVTEIKLGSHVSFGINPHFYGKTPKIKKLIFKLIPNTGTLEANLRSGTIDMISILGLTFDQALAFEKVVKKENLPFNVMFKEGTTYEHVDMDMTNPILADKKVRKALLYGLDREKMVKALFEGKQRVAVHSMSPNDPWYTDDPKKVTIYKYNKRTAIKLLEEAGWKPGPGGIRVKDGQKLSLQFMTTAGNKVRETVQTFMQGQWKEIGVEALIKNEPARVYFGETLKKRAFGALALFAWMSTPESVPRSTYHSDSIPTEKNGWAGQNYTNWKNPEVDKLIDQLQAEFKPAKQKEIAHLLQKHYTEDLPVIPLYYRLEIAVAPKNLKGYRLAGHQYYESLEAENWYLE